MLIWLNGNILLPLKLQSSWFNWKILQEYFSYICILVTFRNALWQLKMAIYSWHMSCWDVESVFLSPGIWADLWLLWSRVYWKWCHAIAGSSLWKDWQFCPDFMEPRAASPALYKFTLQLQKPCVEVLGPHGRKVWSYCARLSRHTCQDDRE